MNLSQGFPLYDSITEVLPIYPESKMNNLIKEAIQKHKPIPEYGDMIMHVMNEQGNIAIVVVDKEKCDGIVSEYNRSMITDIIESNHIPTLLEYLTLSGEYATADKYNTGSLTAAVMFKTLNNPWMPREAKEIMKKEIGDVNEKDKMIFLSFPDGIKSTVLFNALLPYITNIIQTNKEDDNPQHGYIEILLYPTEDYNIINHLVSTVFSVI